MSNKENIISQYIDIYNDISQINYHNNKFINRIIKKYYKKKIYNSIIKLKKFNKPMDKDNLLELIKSLYTNNIPDGNFMNFEKIIYIKISNLESYVAYINNSKNESNIKITIDEINNYFNIIIYNKDREVPSYNLSLIEMKSEKSEINNELYIINKILWNVMSEYLISIIKEI